MTDDSPEPKGEFLLYTGRDGQVKVECRLHDETLWLTQRLMGELFGVGVPAINKHLKNIFESRELEEAAAISILETTAADGKNYQTRFYNLDAIIAVGYRVNSHQATQFRIWATRTLKEFIIKGFVMDDERLKQGGTVFGKDYFDELLERIREIRASERRFSRKSLTFTRCLWTTTAQRRSPVSFSPPFRISCIGRSRGKRPPSKSTAPQTPRNSTWR